MATIISHPAVPLAVGIALGRGVIPARLLGFGLLCSILPDLDVLAFKLGIPYEAMLGHRGFSHSIVFALLAAVAFRIGSKVGRERPWTTFLFLSFATISHGLLDALTNGGLGVGFFAPFSGRRYFFPADWIEVSPIGASFFSARGMVVLKSELLTVWLPCALVAVLGFALRLQARSVRAPEEQPPG